MKLTYQSYGSSILLFINANTNQEAYAKWLSLANWGATSLLNGDEPKFVTDGVISCWSTLERLQKYLFNLHVMRLADSNPRKGVKGGCADEARKLAEADFAAIEHETYRSVNGSFVEHSFGTIEASKPDEDLKDYFLMRGFAS